MKKLFAPFGLTFLLFGSSLPLAAQGPSSPPLPENGGRVPARAPAPTPFVPPAANATPYIVPAPTAAPAAAAPQAPGGIVVPLPTATTEGGPVLPTAAVARAQGEAVSKVRRLIRDVQTNTDNVKAVGNFGAQLYLVADEAFFQDWRKPETPTITPVQLAVRGQPMYTAIIFYGSAHDNKGLSNVSYDLTVTRPDGTVYTERKNQVGWQTFAPDERELQLGRNYIGINITPADPAGLYTVEALIHDNIGRADLPLKQTFVVQ